MSTRLLATAAVDFDADGYMTDYSQWSLEVARALAAEEGIPLLDDRHFAVLNIIRREFLSRGTSPSIRRLAKACGVSPKGLHELFPGIAAHQVARIAGIKKSHGGG